MLLAVNQVSLPTDVKCQLHVKCISALCAWTVYPF